MHLSLIRGFTIMLVCLLFQVAVADEPKYFVRPLTTKVNSEQLMPNASEPALQRATQDKLNYLVEEFNLNEQLGGWDKFAQHEFLLRVSFLSMEQLTKLYPKVPTELIKELKNAISSYDVTPL